MHELLFGFSLSFHRSSVESAEFYDVVYLSLHKVYLFITSKRALLVRFGRFARRNVAFVSFRTSFIRSNRLNEVDF